MSWEDDFRLKNLTTFDGGKDKTLASKMIQSVGGTDGIRTKLATQLDGSTSMLRTRAGNPEVVTTTVKREEPLRQLIYAGETAVRVVPGGVSTAYKIVFNIASGTAKCTVVPDGKYFAYKSRYRRTRRWRGVSKRDFIYFKAGRSPNQRWHGFTKEPSGLGGPAVPIVASAPIKSGIDVVGECGAFTTGLAGGEKLVIADDNGLIDAVSGARLSVGFPIPTMHPLKYPMSFETPILYRDTTGKRLIAINVRPDDTAGGTYAFDSETGALSMLHLAPVYTRDLSVTHSIQPETTNWDVFIQGQVFNFNPDGSVYSTTPTMMFWATTKQTSTFTLSETRTVDACVSGHMDAHGDFVPLRFVCDFQQDCVSSRGTYQEELSFSAGAGMLPEGTLAVLPAGLTDVPAAPFRAFRTETASMTTSVRVELGDFVLSFSGGYTFNRLSETKGEYPKYSWWGGPTYFGEEGPLLDSPGPPTRKDSSSVQCQFNYFQFGFLSAPEEMVHLVATIETVAPSFYASYQGPEQTGGPVAQTVVFLPPNTQYTSNYKYRVVVLDAKHNKRHDIPLGFDHSKTRDGAPDFYHTSAMDYSDTEVHAAVQNDTLTPESATGADVNPDSLPFYRWDDAGVQWVVDLYGTIWADDDMILFSLRMPDMTRHINVAINRVTGRQIKFTTPGDSDSFQTLYRLP